MKLVSWRHYVLALITLSVAVYLIALESESPLFLLPATVMAMGGIVIGIETYRGLSWLTADAPSRFGSALLAGFLAGCFGILCSVTVNEMMVLREASSLPPYGDTMPELLFAARNAAITSVAGLIFGTGLGQSRQAYLK